MYNKRLFLFLVLLIFTQVIFTSFVFSEEREKYLYFTEIDGLPRNITTCIVQDKYGYIWIGTGNGIARYDGKTFCSFDQIKGIGIIYLFIDSKNNLWAGSEKGLYLYNRLTNFFDLKIKGYIPKIQEDNGEIYFMQTGSINKLVGSGIVIKNNINNFADFFISKEGLWCSNVNEGTKLLSRKSGFSEVIATYLNSKHVTVINKIEDNLFFGCHNGQLFVLLKNGALKQVAIQNHYKIKKITKVGHEIWVATDGNGIVVIDANLNFSRILNRNQNRTSSVSSNSIYDVFSGSNREIWIASYGAGLTCILPDNLLFKNIVPEKCNDNSLVANEGVSVFAKNGTFYFGTNYGLSIWNEQNDRYINLSMEKLRKEVQGAKVTGACTDTKNNIWISTYDGLLGKYNAEYKLIRTFHPSSKSPNEMQQIAFMHNFKNTNLLIGSHYQERCFINFDIEKETTSAFELYYKGSKKTFFLFNSIRENQQGELVALISDEGLLHVNLKDNILENKMSKMNKRINCPITDFYHDKKGFYWLTSSTDGLIRVSIDGKIFNKWSLKEGFPTNTLIRIESVDDMFLWISTISGLCRFDMKTGRVLNFNHRDGLPANEFFDRVSAKTDDGRIIFGSIAGFTIVNPAKVTPDTSRTEVVISDITFQNQSIRSHEGKQLLTKPLEETKEITLPFNKNSFSIHFFSKDKNFLKDNNYYYRLVGLEKNWIYLGETNHTTYTNLSSETYTFEIKSTNKSNENSNYPTQLIIHIRPPWYLSWYVYAGYIVLFFTFLYLILYAYLKRVQLKKEKEISEYKIQKEHELTEKKLAFFTNISHDLKTPLTLIDAPVNDLIQSNTMNQEQLNKLIIIHRNSKRLYKLITDLLDFRKITQKQYALEVKETKISKIIEDVYLAFKEECKNKSILFEKYVNEDQIGFFDAKKIEKILWNLLSNALKFTNEGGKIFLSAEVKLIVGKKNLILIVSDNGIGISEKDKGKIFDSFYQARNSNTMSHEGTGIGLSIVKELVEIHHGEILVQSNLGSGTTFTITIPSEKENYPEVEMALFESMQTQQIEDTQVVYIEHKITSNKNKNLYNLPRILVVEDNKELREYLVGHFEKRYRVNQAVDGSEGLKIAKEINPDIILTDVLMPNMNGYEFCKEIRQHFDTSHIPVVMLTANSAIEQQIEGLTTGADAYITKPFDIKLLDSVLYSILENRKKLRNKFMGADPADNLEKSLSKKDIDFILELRIFIEENMLNQDLNVELLSDHFAVSSRQLNRKVKALTGSTPNNLIKSTRLKKAYELLRSKEARVSEVAYLTGFSDPNYFTTCFKKEFGENPSQIGLD